MLIFHTSLFRAQSCKCRVFYISRDLIVGSRQLYRKFRNIYKLFFLVVKAFLRMQACLHLPKKEKKIVKIDGALRTTLTETDKGPMHASSREYLHDKKETRLWTTTDTANFHSRGKFWDSTWRFSTFSKEERTLGELEEPENWVCYHGELIIISLLRLIKLQNNQENCQKWRRHSTEKVVQYLEHCTSSGTILRVIGPLNKRSRALN